MDGPTDQTDGQMEGWYLSLGHKILKLAWSKQGRIHSKTVADGWAGVTGLILEGARKPDALCLALGLSCFENSEPGRLSLLLTRI